MQQHCGSRRNRLSCQSTCKLSMVSGMCLQTGTDYMHALIEPSTVVGDPYLHSRRALYCSVLHHARRIEDDPCLSCLYLARTWGGHCSQLYQYLEQACQACELPSPATPGTFRRATSWHPPLSALREDPELCTCRRQLRGRRAIGQASVIAKSVL